MKHSKQLSFFNSASHAIMPRLHIRWRSALAERPVRNAFAFPNSRWPFDDSLQLLTTQHDRVTK